jgi:hypothetical protein
MRRPSSITEDHSPGAVRARLEHGRDPSYLHDFIYGAIDGAITTFAVVAGVQGASLDASIPAWTATASAGARQRRDYRC